MSSTLSIFFELSETAPPWDASVCKSIQVVWSKLVLHCYSPDHHAESTEGNWTKGTVGVDLKTNAAKNTVRYGHFNPIKTF